MREELFGVERLEQHARTLAEAQSITERPRRVRSLHARLDDNAQTLLSAYRASAVELARGRSAVPAAEWLLDNYHLVEAQVREIRDHLPVGFYRQLPKLAAGPFVGYPRVFGIAWAFVAHTDSHVDPEVLRRFIAAYQTVQPLTIGELWAVAITLRIVLIENLRRLADQITLARGERGDAEALADALLASGGARAALDADIAVRSNDALSEIFAAQLAKRLRDQDPLTMPALGWLTDRLERQGSSVETVVAHVHQRQAVSNVSVRNIITSMRLISDIGWADFFESVSLVDALLCETSAFATLDFATRNLYRSAIEQLARGSTHSELAIAALALQTSARERASSIARAADAIEIERRGEPGFHLIADGRRAFERTVGFTVPFQLHASRLAIRWGIAGYAIALVVTTVALGWLASLVLPASPGLALFAVFAALPFTEVALALVNRVVTRVVHPTPLPALELADGVPAALRTIVVIPTMLGNVAELEEQVERLEVHYLSGAGGELYFALLTDWVDADTEALADDAELHATAVDEIASLNRRHASALAGDRFLLLHRRRRFNDREGRWMGWERKRGKLEELNRLLRGANDTSYFPRTDGAPQVPPDVRYVITLDADTRLPRDAAIRLIGKMGHPLNRPLVDRLARRVVAGFGIMQPRVTPSLPLGDAGSIYQRVYSGPAGIDPYAAATSDVYQDLLGEGSFTGKGIYDVDAFEAALAGRVPENALLSHDLFEGVFARAALASDTELIEDFPTRYDVDARRHHRWMRGDWQLLPWIVGRRKRGRGVPLAGRWKMVDNLRRSLVAPSTFAGLVTAWLLAPRAALVASALLFATLAIPPLLPTLVTLVSRHERVSWRNHLGASARELRLASLQILLAITFLADRAWRATDAIVRTLVRVFVTRRHLLEWTTSAQSSRASRLDVPGFYRSMAGGTGATLVCATLAFAWLGGWTPLVALLAAAWLVAPVVAMRISRPASGPVHAPLTIDEARRLRLIARRTWSYFETFVTAAEHDLPPDNFQEDPKPVVARRTSPTNVGLYLLSAVAARDFGWAGTRATVERLEATFATMARLERHRGHFFNWYATDDLRVLDPPYVSSVDSGNLAGHLIVVANACASWRAHVVAPNVRAGLLDTLALARQADTGSRTPLFDRLGASIERLDAGGTLAELVAELDRVAVDGSDPWLATLARAARQHADDRAADLATLAARLDALATQARDFALAMDFAFLVDPERKLLAIGYSRNDNRLDPSCYDLLASEARLASLFAIAKGDVETKHWFRLGRTATPVGNGSALISWSGSMFEYLMPSLVMRAPFGSLLEQTNRLVVERQRAYGAARRVPWGISESAYNARDLDFTYQYMNFGVPGLGLKRGLADNLVIAPYATGLATMVDPSRALANYDAIASLGGRGHYGFYEALDFTRERRPEGESVALVRNYMAHHQGMTIVAIANTLDDGRMRSRFHAEPIIVASDLLLQERMPRIVTNARPRAEEVKATAGIASIGSSIRRIAPIPGSAPITHLLSNGRYTVMLTASGSGVSRWGDLAITRWREDPTRDVEGSFVYLRDLRNDACWSATTQPLRSTPDESSATFGDDYATFARRDGTLRTTLDVVVSGEADAEVRRVTLTNSGRRAREIELTSYAELVLASPAGDNAHPAFSKLFVQTQRLPAFDALIATRRPRSAADAPVWAAHFAVVEGSTVASGGYETDRARFLGRGRDASTPRAMDKGQVLSNTVGTVLDPIFSLRQRVKVAPGSVVRVSYWTVVAASQAELMDLIDRHHDRNAFDRARTFAWTRAQVHLRHLGVQSDEAADFQRLAAPLLYADARFRATSEAIVRGMDSQSALWPHSISGDRPIAVLRIDDIDDLAQVRQLLRAHEYWRAKGLAVDLVIVNERTASYTQDLQIAIETAIRSSESRPRLGEAGARGAVHALRADLLSTESRALLMAVARVQLSARRGPIAQQLARMPLAPEPRPRPPAPLVETATSSAHPAALVMSLECFNGIGGFDRDGREYVTVLGGSRRTPAPWINVISNPRFGFHVSSEGTGFTWAENSREHQLTPWSNDPVADPPSEVVYVRDLDSDRLYTATAQPFFDGGTYVARHGFGYSRFAHAVDDLELELVQFVPLDASVKVSRLTVTNRSPVARSLSVTAYVEWVLGTSRGGVVPFVATSIDADTRAMFVRNPWGLGFRGRVAFVDLRGTQSAWTGDRTEFLGRHGSTARPAALCDDTPLSNVTGAGLDPCAALQTGFVLGPGERHEVVMLLGEGANDHDARALIERYRTNDLDAVLADVTRHWETLLGTVQVKTPDRATDLLLNGWLLYQTLACRVWARSAFYQASGAYGFRDQLQDGMALTFAMPEQTRSHLLVAASRQFAEGDVQHWWLPHSGQGVRTHISDDRVWLAYAVATYVASTGDIAVLDEPVTWIEGPALAPDQHDAFFHPTVVDQPSSLFAHCVRGLDQCLALRGDLGLPLMGTGDWNDGMNRVGQEGRGESVWLAWLLLRTIALFVPHADARDPTLAERWRREAEAVRAAVERVAWDGAWYRRASFDDGTWLGASDSDECRIDSIAQSWAVLSRAADPARARTAMDSVDRHLVDRERGLALLFTPPFDETRHDPGYIKGYPPGLRENGGQYSHAAMWAVLAFTELGDADRAADLFALLNPINHARTRSDADRYKVEPYVVAADVYSVAPHAGRGGWTWYTGSAAWMYRAGIEGLMGLTREADVLVLRPRLPERWPEASISVRLGTSRYEIRVRRADDDHGAVLDDVPLPPGDDGYRLPLDARPHTLTVTLAADTTTH